MDHTFETFHVTLDDGDRLALHGTGSPAGGGTPLICIPGGPMMSTLVTRVAGLFAQAIFVTQAGAGHYPWRDDPSLFRSTLREWLSV